MKELSAEKRALLAGVLAMAVILVWNYFYKPPVPPKPSAPVTSPAGGSQPGATPAAPSSVAAAAPAVSAAKAAKREETVVVESPLYRVELSNRGAVVRSWLLKKYTDDNKPPRTLDLVRPDAPQAGGWPLSILLDDAQLEATANSAPFEWSPVGAPSCPAEKPGPESAAAASPTGNTFSAPAELCFQWSDGHLDVSKRLKFDGTYVAQLTTSVMLDGKPLAHGLTWTGGFGDATVEVPAEQVFFSAAGKLQQLPYKKLGAPNQPALRQHQGSTFDYAGIEDRYFAAAFLPAKTGSLAVWQWELARDTLKDGKPAKQPVAEVAVGTPAAGPLALRIFVGPKDLDELKKITPPLSDLVQFGWLEFIAAPLFYTLRWLHVYIPNYGWAIIVMTLVINMLLFPLKAKSWRSMQKMQKLQPEMRAIQDRYKKYSLRDPRKQQMNQEIMALYQREGVNPMSGCLPMLPQMPIWFGLYRMLAVTIELRHAPWIGWIHDLSVKDPYYILPVLMGLTMYVMQKMTPTTTVDPAQQRMMMLMPLMFAGMFIIIPTSSGLVLYILSSNVIGMIQQWYLNRHTPATVPARGKNAKKN